MSYQKTEKPFPFRLTLLSGLSLLASLQAKAADPSWWRQDDTAFITSAAPNNYGVANIGQAKNMARCALKALHKVIPQLADDIEADLVGTGKPIVSWTPPSVGSPEAEAQSAPLLVGQLKAIAAPFYEHLHAYAPAWLDLKLQANSTYSSGSYFPWTTTTGDDANKAMATIGQLKAVFALDFASDSEVSPNVDGIPDLWEYGVIHADTTSTWTDPNQITVMNAATIGLTSPAGSPPHMLSLHTSAQVDSRLAGKSASTALPVFTNYMANASSLIFTRNSNFWAQDLVQDLTCMSPFNSYEGNGMAGTVITPRHIIFATHYKIPDGAAVYFVTAAGTLVSRTMVKSQNVPQPPGYSYPWNTDFQIGVLNSDLPSSITPCKVAPHDFDSYLPASIINTYPGGGPPFVPAMGMNQFEEGLVFDYREVFMDGGGNYLFTTIAPDGTKSPKRQEFTKTVIGGDSGNPVFTIVNNHLMLMSTWTSPNGGNATWHAIPQINSTISAVDSAAGITPGTGYTVTEMDLSEFVKF